MAYMKPGSPFLFDELTGDIVGIKDNDGGESYFPRIDNGNVLTVGASGRFSTIQAAVDYINKQPAFLPHPYAAQFNGVASSWVNGTSVIATSTNVDNQPNANNTWFKFTGDKFFYPYDSASNRLIQGAGKVYSAHNRIESGDLAAGKTINWYVENRFTVMLIDPLYHENFTINSDANIVFTSLTGKTLWSGIMTGSVALTSGRIIFSNMHVANGLYDTEYYGVALGGACFQANNSVIIEHDRIIADLISSDWYSYEYYLGALHSRYSVYNQRPSNGPRGHLINLHTAGDQVFQHPVWNMTNADNLSAAGPDAYFIDRFTARNVVIAGLRGNIRDKNSTLVTLALVGAGEGGVVGFEHLLIEDTTLALEGVPLSSGLNIALLTLGANNTAGEATIHNSTILAPTRGAATPPSIRQTRIIANPGANVTVNKGFNPLNQTHDVATANVTYVAL